MLPGCFVGVGLGDGGELGALVIEVVLLEQAGDPRVEAGDDGVFTVTTMSLGTTSFPTCRRNSTRLLRKLAMTSSRPTWMGPAMAVYDQEPKPLR